MSRVITFIIAFFLIQAAFGQKRSNGIGLRIGEPFGVTYKRYMSPRSSLEFAIGSSPKGWSDAYYRNSFDDYAEYENYNYLSHDVESIIYLQGRLLLNQPILIEGLDGTLDWFYGIGGVLKSARVDYRFQGEEFPFDFESEDRTDVDLGPEGILGMEYFFSDIPLTIFGELSLMLEIGDRPGTFRLFGGAGLRYNF